jgi:microcystin-dependent protein
MTISSEVRKAGPFSANGSNKNFAFTFKCFTNEDVRVVLTNSLGVESDLVLDSDYSVTLNPDQNVSAGGTVITTLAYATGNKITLVGDIDYKQETDITNGGGFYPEVIENALDKLTMQIQQLNEAVDRSVKTDISSNENPADFLNSITDSVAEASASAAEAANQVTLAEAQVALAADQVELAADQVDLAADQVALAAGIFDQFDDRYLGSKSSDPALDNDGNALLTGALYWNTSQSRLKVYSGSGWVDTATAEPASFNHNIFSGNGSTTAFTLSNAPATLASMFVFISGVAQRPTTDYTIAGSVITFIPAPPTGTNNISVFVASTVAAGVPDDGSVSTDKIQNGAVTLAKLAASALTGIGAPSGAISFFAMNVAPSGWIKANGAAISRTTYATLFAAIGTTFGVGDGSTTFNIPDLRGEFVRGWDDGRGVDSSRVFGSAQSFAVQSHSHSFSYTSAGGAGSGIVNSSGASGTFTPTQSTDSGDVETRPRNIALLACIKF